MILKYKKVRIAIDKNGKVCYYIDMTRKGKNKMKNTSINFLKSSKILSFREKRVLVRQKSKCDIYVKYGDTKIDKYLKQWGIANGRA